MGRLKLCNAETTREESRDSLPFPSVWSEMQRDARRSPDAAVAEIERALSRMQQQIDAIQEEIDSALHLPETSEDDWPPRAA